MADTINKITSILDLLSGRSATQKIQGISDEVAEKKLKEYDKGISKQLSNIQKELEDIKKSQVTDLNDVVIGSENTIREMIRDEVSQIFLQLYYKRNSWQ